MQREWGGGECRHPRNAVLTSPSSPLCLHPLLLLYLFSHCTSAIFYCMHPTSMLAITQMVNCKAKLFHLYSPIVLHSATYVILIRFFIFYFVYIFTFHRMHSKKCRCLCASIGVQENYIQNYIDCLLFCKSNMDILI